MYTNYLKNLYCFNIITCIQHSFVLHCFTIFRYPQIHDIPQFRWLTPHCFKTRVRRISHRTQSLGQIGWLGDQVKCAKQILWRPCWQVSCEYYSLQHFINLFQLLFFLGERILPLVTRPPPATFQLPPCPNFNTPASGSRGIAAIKIITATPTKCSKTQDALWD